DPALLLEDTPFRDPTSLFITPDHYVTRLLHARGVSLSDLGVGRGPLEETEARRAWRLLAEHWHAYAGTPSRLWMEHEFHEVFGIGKALTPATADELYDHIAERLTRPEVRPRALFDSFRIEVLATTDDPADDLAAHRALAEDPAFTGLVAPTFRPDKYLEPAREDFAQLADALGEAAGIDTGDYVGFTAAMRARRLYFREHGAVAPHHSHAHTGTARLSAEYASRLSAESRPGRIVAPDAA